ncbi:MAG: hypothetical protein QF824_05515 [Candidatus Woesearchaeota archaeon]|jgi:hypothetical protein|nr:hypothetical protein [Candidatus Woesearchaeota archaeon]
MNHNGDSRKGDLVRPTLTPQKRNFTSHIVIVISVIVILVVIALVSIKQPTPQSTGTITPIEEEPAFNEEDCLNLLRDHVEFGELEFEQEPDIQTVGDSRNIIKSNVKDPNSKIIIGTDENTELVNYCQIQSQISTSTDYSKSKEFTCDNNAELKIIEEDETEHKYLAIRASIGDDIFETILYSNLLIDTSEFKINIKNLLSCNEVTP